MKLSKLIQEIKIIGKKLKGNYINKSTIHINNLPSFSEPIVATIDYHPYGNDQEGKVIISLRNESRMSIVEKDLDNMKISYEVDPNARRRSILIPKEYLELK